jgi:hypothetical protein
MENIVANSKSLSWDGWDVISLKKTPGAIMSPQGAFVNGSWYLKDKFVLSETGWEIPDKFVR